MHETRESAIICTSATPQTTTPPLCSSPSPGEITKYVSHPAERSGQPDSVGPSTRRRAEPSQQRSIYLPSSGQHLLQTTSAVCSTDDRTYQTPARIHVLTIDAESPLVLIQRGVRCTGKAVPHSQETSRIHILLGEKPRPWERTATGTTS